MACGEKGDFPYTDLLIEKTDPELISVGQYIIS